ncbi:MAG: transglutaminase-like domain-containing protein [Akkermansiaceae bacterium]|nr:transglutaminase-like domain-containing protein [Akkermansiaceae bacterium]
MIIRLVGLCACGAGAYALLRGWPEGLPVLLRACLAVLLLAAGLGWWSVRKSSNDVPAAGGGKPGWRDMLVVGTGFLALECGFLWLLSAAPAPLEEMALVIEERLRPEAAAERVEAEGGGAISGNWLWENGTRRELPMRTNLKPGAKPEVFVKLRSADDAKALLKRKVYVRAFALGDFADSTWSMSEAKVEEIAAGEDGWVRFGETDEREILHEVFHAKDAGARDLLTTLQGVRAVRLPEIRVAADGMNFLPNVGGATGFRYLASSLPVGLDDLKGVKLEAERGAEGQDRIAILARKAAGEGTVVERLVKIRDFLRESYGYSLVTENPQNLEPLENFLFGEKRGHCEFFATAGALMAREIGVESRVAYGWAGGSYFKDDQMFVFVAREAHAWVEVKLDGYGWVVMDPTPPMVLGGGGAPRVAEAGDEVPEPLDELSDEEYADVGGSHVERTALILMGGFGGLAVVLFFLKGRASRAGVGGGLIRGERRAGYIAAWEKACSERAVRRKKGDTLKAQLASVAPVPEFSEELLGYHYGVRYEGKSAEPETERNLIRRMREWGRADAT